MAKRKKSGLFPAGRGAFLMLLAGGVLLAIAGLLYFDPSARLALDSRADARPVVVSPARETVDVWSQVLAVVREIATVRISAVSALARPPRLELVAGPGFDSGEFRHLLERSLALRAIRILSWGEGPARKSVSIGLGRREPEVICGVTLPGARGSTIADKLPALSRKDGVSVLDDTRGRAVRHPRIALILDDAGGEGASQWLFLDLPMKLNFAVIPGQPQSHRFAVRARAAGHTVLVHMPMQPRDGEAPELKSGRMLAPGMTVREIDRLLDEAGRSVPGAVGVNNHMGSLATADRNLMRMLMGRLRQRNLFFVDSRTHAASVAAAEAVAAGMPSRVRDIFIDHEATRAYIENAVLELARMAFDRGQAIAIGHVTHLETWQVLRDLLPLLEAKGIRFVSVAELP